MMITIITSCSSLVVALVTVLAQNRVLSVKIDNLAEKVNKHNNVVERTYKLEADMATVWKRYDDMADDIGALEEKTK